MNLEWLRKRLGLVRLCAVVSMTAALFYVAKIAMLAWTHPEAAVPESWNLGFWAAIGIMLICAAPLWFFKVEAMRKFEAELVKIYGNDQKARERARAEMMRPLIKQMFIITALITLVYVLIHYYAISP